MDYQTGKLAIYFIYTYIRKNTKIFQASVSKNPLGLTINWNQNILKTTKQTEVKTREINWLMDKTYFKTVIKPYRHK